MKRKGIVLILALLMCLCCAIGLTACGQSAECDHSGAQIVIKAVAGTCNTEGTSAGKKCARCGVVTEEPTSTGFGTHVYGETYEKDDNQHWRVCTVCNEPETKVNHTGGTLSCGTQKECEVCAKAYGEVGEHQFPEGVYTTDGNSHWIKCIYCDAKKDGTESAHTGGTATCQAKAVCTTCGLSYGEKLGHSFTIDRRDTVNHWKQCATCTEIQGLEAHKGGVQSCTEDKVCSVCDITYGVASGHDFIGGTTLFDATHHWKKCKNCNVEDVDNKVLHTGGTATCAGPAICEDCNTEYGQALEHDFVNGTIKYNATAHWKQCANCTAEDIENKANHEGGTATCTSKKHCTVCSQEYGDLASHLFGATYHVDNDFHWQECTNCGASNTKVAHIGGTATCTSKKVCSICEEQYGKLANHDYASSTTYRSSPDGHWKKCANCDAEDVENATPHSGGTATCIARATCTTCNMAYGDYANHKFGTVNDIVTEAGHAKSCTVAGCDAHTTPIEHTPDRDAPTSTLDKKCTGCSWVFEPATNHDHARKSVRDYDGTSHWFECECGFVYEETKGTHVFDNNCDGECNICGYTRAVSHDFANGDYVATDANYHWKRCKICFTEDVAGKVPHVGGTATCTSVKTCTECGAHYGTMLSHDFVGGSYVYSDTAHWKKCANCTAEDTANKVSHVVGTAATCTTKAKCKDCKQEYGAVLGHKISSTYTSDGTNHWKKCTNTGCSYVQDKKAHSGGTATCTAAKVCSTCSKSYGTALGHTYANAKYGTDGSYHWLICDRCSVADTDNKEVHVGGTATCTAKKVCTTCKVSYGSLASHSYTTTKTSSTEHWTVCSKCSAEKSGSRAAHSGGAATCTAAPVCSTCSKSYGSAKGHSLTKYATDATNHWKACANCTYQDTSTKAAHTGGTPTESAQPVCSTCKASYGNKLVKHTVGSFDNDSYLYMAGGTANDFWCWPRHIGTTTKKTGTGALQIEPHATDGQWPGIQFNHNGSALWNLSKATSISVTTCSGASAQGTLFLQLKDANSKSYQVKVTGTSGAWITTTINIADAKNAGVNVASCYVSFEANYALVTSPNRNAIYLDDLCVYESVGDTSWDTVYAASTYCYFDSIANGVRPDGANATTSSDIDYVVEDSWDWQPMVDLDKRLGSVGRGLVLTKQGNGQWPGIYLKNKGNKAFDFSKTAYIKLWVYNDGTGNIASGAMTLQVRTTAGAGLATNLAVTKAINKGEWAEFIIDVAAYRKANPSVSLTSCWLHFGNHASTYPAAATVLRLENFEVISQI